jgi:hypothetical protein
LGTVFEILINTGFIKYNSEGKGLDEAVLESEKKVVFLIWGLLGGEKSKMVLRENLGIFLMTILGLDSTVLESIFN